MKGLAAAINGALLGAVLQKAWADDSGRVCLKLRLPGRTVHLLVGSAPAAYGVGTVPDRIPTPRNPPALAAYLRAHAEGARLAGAAPFGERGVSLHFSKTPGGATLALEGGRQPRIVLCDLCGAAKVATRWDAVGGAVRPGGAVAGLASAPSAERLEEAEALALLAAEGERLVGASAWEEEREAHKYVGRWRKKLLRRIENIRRDLLAAPDPAELKRKADALAASLHLAGKGVAEVEDPAEPGRMIAVDLDSRLSPGKNLEEFYRAARRASRAKAVAGERLKFAEAELEAGEAPKARGARETKAGGEPAQPYRRYKSSDGWLILVGRNRVENDRLVKGARPWDVWLHAEGGAGAHVVIKKPGRESKVPERTLIEAAGLAAENSARSGEGAVDVLVAEISRVKKPKGAGAGRVLVSGGKTVRAAPGAGKAKAVP